MASRSNLTGFWFCAPFLTANYKWLPTRVFPAAPYPPGTSDVWPDAGETYRPHFFAGIYNQPLAPCRPPSPPALPVPKTIRLQISLRLTLLRYTGQSTILSSPEVICGCLTHSKLHSTPPHLFTMTLEGHQQPQKENHYRTPFFDISQLGPQAPVSNLYRHLRDSCRHCCWRCEPGLSGSDVHISGNPAR